MFQQLVFGRVACDIYFFSVSLVNYWQTIPFQEYLQTLHCHYIATVQT